MANGIDIYRSGEKILANIPIPESAVHKATLMKEDYIKVSFTDSVRHTFKSGDYIVLSKTDGSYVSSDMGMAFYLADDYYPTMTSEAEYSYELQFNAPWYNLANYLFLFLTETPIGGNTYVTRRGSEWEFTGTAAELISLIVKNTQLTSLYDANGNLLSTRTCPCRLSSLFYCEPTEVKSFTFSSTDIIGALNQMSSQYELEWWVERLDDTYILHFGECDNSIVYDSDNTTLFNEDGTRVKDSAKQVELVMGENVSKPSVKQNEALKRYYFVYGSSRNIDQSITDLDVNAIATKRLSLNNPIDKGIGSGEEVVIFDDIYPKSDYQITRVDSYETESETIVGYDTDGNPVYAIYTVYQVYLKAFSDMVMSLIANDENVQTIEDIVAAGKKLSVKFITHDYNGTTVTPLLAGWEFEVGAVLKTDSTSQWYELQLLHQEINDYIIPNTNLYPKGVNNGTATDVKGNKTVIQGVGDAADWVCVFNIKGAYVDADETSNAKTELTDAFNKYYANKKKNISYTVTPYVDTDIDLAIGDAVKLTYGNEVVVSRVNSFTKHLDYLIDASYEMCSYTNKGPVNSLKDEVKVLNAVVNRIGSASGIDANAVADIVSTVGNKKYLRKDTEDVAAKHITFESGVNIKGGAVADSIEALDVNAPTGEIKTLTTNSIRSDNYSSVSGYRMENVDGDSVIDIDKLYVRKKAIFTELDIKSLKHIGGAILLSPASCKIASVEKVMSGSTITGYKCYFLATDGEETINNEWVVGDQAICNKYNITKLHHYWRLVTAVSASPINGYHYVILSKPDCDDFSNVPQAGDEIVCLGNRNDVDRQSAIFLNSEGTDAPSLLQLNGINSYSLESENIITQLSKSRNIIRGQQVEVITESGNKSVKQFADEALAGANSYSDGIGNALKEFVGERETYLQAQITQNASDITLRANKTTVDAIEGRVSNAEAKIQVNAGNINLKADKTTVDVIDGRVSKAEADIQVNSDGISSVVSKSNDVYRVYDKDSEGFYEGISPTCYLENYDLQGSGYRTGLGCCVNNAQYCTLMISLTSVNDRLRFNVPVNIYYWDGDNSAVDELLAMINDGTIDEQDLGGMPLEGMPGGYIEIYVENEYEANTYEYLPGFEVAPNTDFVVDSKIIYSGWLAVKVKASYKDSFKAYLFTERANAESRIRQTADEIELKVGNTGINLDKKQITLSAANTIVKGDLSVQRVMTYYSDGAVRSAYNGNGNGTIVYFYQNGNKMREDVFIYDAKGNATGMATIYYNANGSVSWKLTSNGFETSLADYWTYEEGMAYSTSLGEIRNAIGAYKTSGSIDLPTDVFSTFKATTQSAYQAYNNKVVRGRVASAAVPTGRTFYTGYYFRPIPMQRLEGNEFFLVYTVNDGVVTGSTEIDVI